MEQHGAEREVKQWHWTQQSLATHRSSGASRAHHSCLREDEDGLALIHSLQLVIGRGLSPRVSWGGVALLSWGKPAGADSRSCLWAWHLETGQQVFPQRETWVYSSVQHSPPFVVLGVCSSSCSLLRSSSPRTLRERGDLWRGNFRRITTSSAATAGPEPSSLSPSSTLYLRLPSSLTMVSAGHGGCPRCNVPDPYPWEI